MYYILSTYSERCRSADHEPHVFLDLCVIFFHLHSEHRQFEQLGRHVHVHNRIEVPVVDLQERAKNTMKLRI